ncbi:PAS domain S-box-containing protein [Mucilaginibacter sp. UYP25]|uniref:sensor histidine kinase n=1 Tax=unclassified Mucilaginibacter TaxID=2617802 RepID=UPI00339B269D
MDDKNTSLINGIEGQGQLLIAALSASISGIVITDWLQTDNPIIFCNSAFEEMTGFSQEEILGRNCRFLQGENREQIGRFKLQEALSAGIECHVELANYRKDGTLFYNELYIAPIKNHNEIVTHYIGIQNDITVRKQKEISLELELKLQKQKDEFTNLASHELRTPITSLRATLQLINRIIKEKQIEDERLIELAQNAERHTKKLGSLVDDLLITTVLPNEELALNKTVFSFLEVIDGCCNHISMNGTHIVEKAGDMTLKICADQHKIDQVMINLLNNAIKFAPKSKNIIIGVEQINSFIKISVTDKGIGIAEKNIASIFERFKKVDNGQHSQSGLGMGLYVCSEIIKRHGGKIGVESVLGQGSSFWFTLPER